MRALFSRARKDLCPWRKSILYGNNKQIVSIL